MKNKVMMNIEVPAFWYLDVSEPLSVAELDYHQKLHENVVYIKLRKTQNATSLGIKTTSASVF